MQSSQYERIITSPSPWRLDQQFNISLPVNLERGVRCYDFILPGQLVAYVKRLCLLTDGATDLKV